MLYLLPAALLAIKAREQAAATIMQNEPTMAGHIIASDILINSNNFNYKSWLI